MQALQLPRPVVVAVMLVAGSSACSGGAVPDAKSSVPLGPSRVAFQRPPSGCPNGAVQKGDGLCVVCDLSEGDEHCSKMCEGGDGDACANLGFAHHFGALGRTPDAMKARALFERGCSLGSADACEGVAACYFSGLGYPKDLTRAFEIRWALCEKGKGSACSSVSSTFFRQGKIDEGFRLAEKGCALGDPAGCERLAERCVTHRPSDVRCRDEALKAACGVGDNDACDWIKGGTMPFARQ